MKIGLDARVISKGNFTGIPRSVFEILRVWVDRFPENEYYLLSDRPVHIDIDLPTNWHVIDTPWVIKKGKLWAAFKLPKLIKMLDLDVYWGTNYTLPRRIRNKTKFYVTIYDLSLVKFKGIGQRDNIIRLRCFAQSACKRAEKVIAISNATAKDITDVFGITKEKIVVSYCGGLPHDYEKNRTFEISEVRRELQHQEDFFLFIGTIEPRKNILTIVRAFEKYVEETKNHTQLILAGGKGWKCDDIYSYINNSKCRDKIICPGFINEDEKKYLLSKAQLFVYPSLYEGFGIPVLEAFSYGVPVLTTNISSLPEVGGDAAFYIDDPYDINGLKKLMIEICSLDEDERGLLQERMNYQLNKFSWEKNAYEIMRVITRKT